MMEREIKFRAWHIKDKFMAYNCWQISTTLVEIPKLNYRETETWCCHMMQYIGLKDNRGKDVYAGDIMGSGNDKGVVVWVKEYSGFRVSWKDPNGTEIFQSIQSWIKVIGNIYENPELLTNKQK